MNFKVKWTLILLSLMLSLEYKIAAQSDSLSRPRKEEYYYSSIDTIRFKGREIEVEHVLKRTMGLNKRVFSSWDSIFDEMINDFSFMSIIKKHQEIINIPTIPIDNIIIDDENELIIGLSRAIESPYQLVIYNFDGTLLFKKKLSSLEIVLDSISCSEFQNSFPQYYSYAYKSNQIVIENGLYYVDLGYWHLLSDKEKAFIESKDWIKPSHYFPYLFREQFGTIKSYELAKYQGFYSQTDPFYEFEITDRRTLTSIVLNNEFGGKVRIPVGEINLKK